MLKYIIVLLLGLAAFAFVALIGPSIRNEVRHQLRRRGRHRRR